MVHSASCSGLFSLCVFLIISFISFVFVFLLIAKSYVRCEDAFSVNFLLFKLFCFSFPPPAPHPLSHAEFIFPLVLFFVN